MQFWQEGSSEIDFILTRDNEPVAAREVKSGRAKGLPARETLENNGIACPLRVVSRENAEEFLQTATPAAAPASQFPARKNAPSINNAVDKNGKSC